MSTTLPKTAAQKAETAAEVRTVLFKSAIGWCSLSHADGVLTGISMGQPNRQAAFEKLMEAGRAPVRANGIERPMVEQLKAYLNGQPDPKSGRPIGFLDWNIDQSWMTDFQRRCVDECRRIPFGQTVSYGELAAKIGSPRGARAVGGVMRTNRTPLLIPCHRVVRSGGGLGGFTSPQGVSLKSRLLTMERELLGSV